MLTFWPSHLPNLLFYIAACPGMDNAKILLPVSFGSMFGGKSMLFTNVMKTLVLIGLFIAIPMVIINFSWRRIARLIQGLKTRPHRS